MELEYATSPSHFVPRGFLGDPSLGRKVDIIESRGSGVDQFYRVNLDGVSTFSFF